MRTLSFGPIRPAAWVGAFLVLALATLWLADARVARLWINTALLAAGAAAIALPLGTVAALLIAKTDMPGRRFATLLFVGTLFLPLYIVTGAWDAGFGIQGWQTLSTNPHLAREPWLAGWQAAIWIHGMAAVPWVVLILGATFRAVEAEIEEDAATCASPPRVIWHVTLRRAAPAFVVAALWIAMIATAEISVTDFFQVRTFAEEVYTQSALGTFDAASGAPSVDPRSPGVLPQAAGLWVGLGISLSLAILFMVVAVKLFADFTEASERAPWTWRLAGLRWLAVLVMLGIMLLVAAIPLGNLLYKAGIEVTMNGGARVRTWSVLKAVRLVFTVAPVEFRYDLWLSIRLGILAATAALAAAVPLAWSMRRTRPTPWIRLALLAACLTIPGPLLGIAVIHLLNRPANSPLAFLGWLYDSNFSPWLVQTIRALSVATLILWPALSSVPQVMLDTAATEGCRWWGQLLRIALPQRWPAVAAAWLIALAIAMGELAATILVIRPQPRGATALSVRIFQMLHYGVDDHAAAISLLMVLAIATLTGLAAALLRRNHAIKRRDDNQRDSTLP